MSGQILLGEVPNENHLRIAALFDDRHHTELRRPTHVRWLDARRPGHGRRHRRACARRTSGLANPLDPKVQPQQRSLQVLAAQSTLRIKRQLLDQTVVSGIGNIYAGRGAVAGQDQRDSARFVADPARSWPSWLDAAADVMTHALGQGGTSFDSMLRQRQRRVRLLPNGPLDAYGPRG